MIHCKVLREEKKFRNFFQYERMKKEKAETTTKRNIFLMALMVSLELIKENI